MTRVSIDTAQKELSNLIRDVVRGGHVVITQDAEDVAEIVPVTKAKPKPQFGSAKGLISIGEDFEAPLPDFEEYSR